MNSEAGENPFNAHVEFFSHISYRELSDRWNGRHDPNFKYSEKDMPSFEDLLGRGFRFIPSREQHTMLRVSDNANVAYRVPSSDISQNGKHINAFMNSMTKLNYEVNGENGGGARGLKRVAQLCAWIIFDTKGDPVISAAFKKQRREGEQFLNANQELWKRAGEILKVLFPGKYQMLLRGNLPKRLRRFAKPWMGCSVNIGVPKEPVRTKPHKDGKGAIQGRSCLCCFGDFTGGHLILWELKAILELRAGDVVLFADHILTHSNTTVEGVRHSMVAFTHQRVLEWIEENIGYNNEKNQRVKKRRQKVQEEKQKGGKYRK